MIFCRIPDGGLPQYYVVEDTEIVLTRMRDLSSVGKATLPRKPRGWRYDGHLGNGVAGYGCSKAEAEDMALSEY